MKAAITKLDRNVVAPESENLTEGFDPSKLGRPDQEATKAYDKTQELEAAWGIIANAGNGDWNRENTDWRDAAIRWRDRYHQFLKQAYRVERNSRHDRDACSTFQNFRDWLCRKLGCSKPQPKAIVLVYVIGADSPIPQKGT
jgi:hypothetical protein